MQLLPEPYKRFGLKKITGAAMNIYKLARVIRKEKIETIHAFCTPAGGIAYILSRLTGTKLIIDSYEPHAESMVENGTWKKNGWAYKILFALEKRQTRHAIALIGTTGGMKKYAFERYGIQPKNFFVKPACVDLEKFFPAGKNSSLLKELGFENKIVCVYAGKLGGIYLKDEVFKFIKLCYDHWKDDFRFLMLTNATKDEINSEIQRVKLPENIVVSKFVYHDEVPRYLSLGDFAINPVKPVPTKRFCTSIKDGEYWAMGLPVVISPQISDDSEIIEKESTGVVVDFSDSLALSKAIEKLEFFIKDKVELKEKIRQIAIRYRSFELAKKIYKEIYS
jgi:glycosyltransferase involved in cell wall biosynthesis